MKTIAVTGAYGYSGKYIAAALLREGYQVITLTGQPQSASPFNGRVPAHPFSFDRPERLAETLRGTDTLVNTYWVRFDYGGESHQTAVANTQTLFEAAAQAGVRRVVHISITNPALDSPLPYFSGKAQLETALRASGISYAILRPTVIFGREDILINNIAWLLRRFPLFAVPGDGEYRLQPIYVEDLARLVVEQVPTDKNAVIDATGPETYTFNQLVDLLKGAVGGKAAITHLAPGIAYRLSQLLGHLVGDVMLTREEIQGLMDDLLVTSSPPAGDTKLSEWVKQHAESLGKSYANELKRHYN